MKIIPIGSISIPRLGNISDILCRLVRGPTAALAGDVNLIPPFFCLLAVVLNQALFRLGAMPLVWSLVLVLTVGLTTIIAPHVKVDGARNPGSPNIWNVSIGLVLLAPLLASFALSANREFPFSGDAYFHVTQNYRMAYWWLSPVASTVAKLPTIEDVRRLFNTPWTLLWSRAAVLTIIVAITWFFYRRNRYLALLFATVTLISWGLLEQTIFLRYPGGEYMLRMPFLGPAFLFNNLELTGRLANICAAIAWLFIFRPWLFGCWPDFRILPIAVLLFWQKDIIYYFNSAYLEPWAIVFSLLAVETLATRGEKGAPQALLLVGLAAAIKEPFIVALPFMWLAGAAWRGPLRETARLSGVAIAAGIPFTIYYAARMSVSFEDMGPQHNFKFGLKYDDLIQYLAEFIHQMAIAFTGASAVLAITALALIPFVLWKFKQDRISIAGSVAAGLGIILLFVCDQNSQYYAGYFRFLLCSIPFLAVGVLVLGFRATQRTTIVLSGVILLVQAPSAYIAISRAAGTPTEQNFVEHYDSPIVFPIKSIIGEAEQKGLLPHNPAVLANRPDAMIRPLPGSNVQYGPTGEIYCECNSSHPAVLALFIRYTNMSAKLGEKPSPPGSRLWTWRRNREQAPTCLVKLQQTCSHVLVRNEGSELVAILGIDPKAPQR